MVKKAIITILILIPSLIVTGLVIRWIGVVAPHMLGFPLPGFVFVILYVTGFSIVFSVVAGPLFKSLRTTSQNELSSRRLDNRTDGSGLETGQLVLIRAHSYVDRIRAYQVIIDGVPAGPILDGERKIYTLSQGNHEIALKIDWCGSTPVKFSINMDERKYLTCGPNLDGIRFLLFPWYVTFGRRRYLRLKWQVAR